jgi:hypothetical protein
MKKKRNRRLGKTTEQFIVEATKVHSDRYTYLRSQYLGADIKTPITCKLHGDFMQSPKAHIRGYGCSKCAYEWNCERVKKNPSKPKKTIEQFIIEATLLHCNLYRYVRSIYLGAHMKIAITCLIHGDFEQTPHNHLKGQGCPKCSHIDTSHITRRIPYTNIEIDEYLMKNKILIKRLGGYKNSRSRISWQCLVCNKKWITSFSRIKTKQSICARCNNHIAQKTNEDIDLFIDSHNLPLKRIGEYINSYTKIDFQCDMCDYIWMVQPCEITRIGSRGKGNGSGCPKCARGRNEKIVGKTLEKLEFEQQRIRIDLPTGQKMFPDYFFPELNMIIEYNGIQHYQITQFGSQSLESAQQSFEKQIKRDSQMREYCQEQNIELWEIDGRKYKGKKLEELILSRFIETGVSYE